MTVARLRTEMPSSEFTSWLAFDQLENERMERDTKHAPTADARDDEDDD